MRVSRRTKALVGSLLATAAVTATAMPASAHMGLVTYGTTFTAGATNVFYFRVPHGCADPAKFDATTNPTGTQAWNAHTTSVVVNVPATVTSVKPEQKPGWDLSITRDLVSNAVTQIVWTVRDPKDDLTDYTYGDFGVRATLNGAAGDVIAFETSQICARHDDGTVLDPALTEPWTGANAPKLTLVAASNGVQNAADLANLKTRVIALETSVAGALTSIGNLLTADTTITDRVAAAETSIGDVRTSVTSLSATARLGFAKARLGGGGRLSLTIDAPTVLRNSNATVKVNGTATGTVTLNGVGDFVDMLSVADSAAYHKGDTVKVYIGKTLVAQTTVS